MDNTGRIELVIADDNVMVLSQMQALLDMEADLKVVGGAKNGVELIQLVEKFRPDVVLMDLKMPHMDGFEAAQELKANYPDVHIVFLTMYDNERYKDKALELGADAYLVKGLPIQEVLDTIKDSVKKKV